MFPWLRNLSKEFLQQVYFRDQFMWRLAAGRGAIALTFDDGPHPEFTPAVLDVLGHEKVRATFFMIGEKVEKYPEIARRVVAEGHAIAGHSYDHRPIVARERNDLARDLNRCREAIVTATGADTVLFRPPKGEVDFASIRRVCRMGYQIVHWSKTYSDYKQDGTAALIARLLADPMRPRDIGLFHDHNPYTVEALSQVIPVWRSSGLSFGIPEVPPRRKTLGRSLDTKHPGSGIRP